MFIVDSQIHSLSVYVRENACECMFIPELSKFVFLNGISFQHLELRLAVCCFLLTVVVGGCGQESISDLNNPRTRRHWMLRLHGKRKNTHIQTHTLSHTFFQRVFHCVLASVSFLLHTGHLFLAFQGWLSWRSTE